MHIIGVRKSNPICKELIMMLGIKKTLTNG